MGLFDKVRQAFRGKSTADHSTQMPETVSPATPHESKPFEISVQEGEIRKGHTAQGTGAQQQKFQRPVQTYIADGDMFEVDENQRRLFPDTGNGSIPRGPMSGTWQSRAESYSQADVDRFLDPESPTYNPANYERMMAQARCDAYAEVQSGSHVWDEMTRDERNAMRISNPQRAQALEQNFFARLDEKYGPDDGTAMAMEYGYTQKELYGEGITEEWDGRTDADFDRGSDWVGDDDMDSVPNRSFTPREAMQELEESRPGVAANPYLDADAEKASLEALDQEELKTGVIRPQSMYPSNDGFVADREPTSLKAGDVVSRFEEKGRSGSTGTFASRAVMGDDGKLRAPSFQDRSMVEMEETMQQHFFQVADDFAGEETTSPETTGETAIPESQRSASLSEGIPEALEPDNTRVDALRQSLDQSVDESSPETAARAGLSDYFARTGYGPQDKAIYEADPEWQALHRAAYPEFYAEQGQAEQKFQPYQETLPAGSISGVDTSDPNFWNHHGNDRQNYMELASHLLEVQERMREGATYEELRSDPVLGPTARAYYSPDDPITVEKQADGSFAFGSDGRHRIAAAQELGYDVEAKVMYDHGWKAPEQSVSDTTVDSSDAVPTVDGLADSDFSTGEAVGIGAAMGTAAAITQSESQSGSSASSVSLGDRFQSSYADRIRQTPSLESNRWAGERGESVCAPQSDAARQIMEERGISGVQYQDGVPDFSPFSESTVKLGYMTDARHSQGLTAGRDGKDTIYAHFEDGETVSESHHADKSSMADLHMKYDKPGNFEQADALTAEQWTADGRDGKEWTAEDVAQYRRDNGLTWHECNDMETMQMIPEAINADFGHLGGVGEVKETQRIVDEALRDYDEGQMVEGEDYDRMTPEELEAAAREHGHYTDDGVWVAENPGEADIDGKVTSEADVALDESSQQRMPDQSDADQETLAEADTAFDEALQQRTAEESGEPWVDQKAMAEADAAFDEALQQRAAEEFGEIDGATSPNSEFGVENVSDGGDNLQDQSLEEELNTTPDDQSPVDDIPDGAGNNSPDEEPDSGDDLPPDNQPPVDGTPDDGGDNPPDEEPDGGDDLPPDGQPPVDGTPDDGGDNPPDEEPDGGDDLPPDGQPPVDGTPDDGGDNPPDEGSDGGDDLPPDGQPPVDGAPDDGGDNPPDEGSDGGDDLPPDGQPPVDGTPDDGGDNPPDEGSDGGDDLPPDDQPPVDGNPDDGRDNPPDEKPDGGDDLPPDDHPPVDGTPDDGGDNLPDEEPDGGNDLPPDDQPPVDDIPDDGGDNLPDEGLDGGDEIDNSLMDTDSSGVNQEIREQAAQEAAETEAEEQAAQEAAEAESAEQAAQETAETEAEEQAAQEAAELEAEEQAAQELAEAEAEEQAVQEAAEAEAAEQAAQEAAEIEAEEQATQEAAEAEAEEQAAQEAAEAEAEEQAAQEAAEAEAEEQAAQEAAEQEAEEQAAQEAAEAEAEEQATQEGEEQAAQEAAEAEVEEQAAQEAAEAEAEEQTAQEAAEAEAEEQVAQEAAEAEAEEQAAQEAAEQEAEEQAAQEAAEAEAEEQAAQEAAEAEAEEQAAQEAAEAEAEEQAAQEAVEAEAEEQAAQEVAEIEAEEQEAQEAAAYDDLADERPEDDFSDTEDYSDLADETVDESFDDSGFEDMADDAPDDYADDMADYSDMADDIDSSSFDDSSFDSGDTGSFDGGGDSIE